jgi:hypothetical protein
LSIRARRWSRECEENGEREGKRINYKNKIKIKEEEIEGGGNPTRNRRVKKRTYILSLLVLVLVGSIAPLTTTL